MPRPSALDADLDAGARAALQRDRHRHEPVVVAATGLATAEHALVGVSQRDRQRRARAAAGRHRHLDRRGVGRDELARLADALTVLQVDDALFGPTEFEPLSRDSSRSPRTMARASSASTSAPTTSALARIRDPAVRRG